MAEPIQHLKCSVCNENITYIDDGNIMSVTHFDISRAKKDFVIVDRQVIEEGDPNVKMFYSFCQDCFDKILNESRTLGQLFYVKDVRAFIY